MLLHLIPLIAITKMQFILRCLGRDSITLTLKNTHSNHYAISMSSGLKDGDRIIDNPISSS